MTERKIFNFESKILTDETVEKYGYSPDNLGEHSAKFVVAICRYCGEKSDIRKGFFNKSGSACHKACRIEEMKKQDSPFKRKEVIEKSQKTITERYGADRASIKAKQAESSVKGLERRKKTCLDKYGVENVFQAEVVKDKIKSTMNERYNADTPLGNPEILAKMQKTNMDRYGAANVLKNPAILEKMHATCKERYGVENISNHTDIAQIRKEAKTETVKTNVNYDLVSFLKEESFWESIQNGFTFKDICAGKKLDYANLIKVLHKEEFKKRYEESYSCSSMKVQECIFDLCKTYFESSEMNNESAIPYGGLDIYIPEKNFAIEYRGNLVDSEAFMDIREAQQKYKKKLELCRTKNIRLFQIFEHQWDTRKDQILNFIKSILGLNMTKVMARKCSMSNANAHEFIQNNHIQGDTVNVLKYFNLIYDGEIVASMTASRHHRQNGEDSDVVLSRLCFKDGVNVQGGASKLLSYFIAWAKEKEYKRIVSWSDSSWTEGGIYRTLGFSLEEELRPDYFYYSISEHKIYSKQSQKKSNSGCPPEITERDWSLSRGLVRVWDSGKRRFILPI